jgi:CRISPR/Cas system-associated endoribonuclease Cas2
MENETKYEIKEVNVSTAITEDGRKKKLEKLKDKMIKDNWIFDSYFDGGMTKTSRATFKRDLKYSDGKKDMTKGVKILLISSAIVLFFIVIGISGDSTDTKIIHKAEYGTKWAITTDTATLKCYNDNGIKSPVIIVDGVTYGLTGFADNKYGQSDLKAFHKIWLKDNTTGANINLSSFTDDALKLCD